MKTIKFRGTYYTRHDNIMNWTCLAQILIVIAYVILAGMSINYLLPVFGLEQIGFGWALLIGIIAGEVTIPIAIVVMILRFVGVL